MKGWWRDGGGVASWDEKKWKMGWNVCMLGVIERLVFINEHTHT